MGGGEGLECLQVPQRPPDQCCHIEEGETESLKWEGRDSHLRQKLSPTGVTGSPDTPGRDGSPSPLTSMKGLPTDAAQSTGMRVTRGVAQMAGRTPQPTTAPSHDPLLSLLCKCAYGCLLGASPCWGARWPLSLGAL